MERVSPTYYRSEGQSKCVEGNDPPPVLQAAQNLIRAELLLSEGPEPVRHQPGSGPGDVLWEGEEVRLTDSLQDSVAVLRVPLSQQRLEHCSVAVHLQLVLLTLPQLLTVHLQCWKEIISHNSI